MKREREEREREEGGVGWERSMAHDFPVVNCVIFGTLPH